MKRMLENDHIRLRAVEPEDLDVLYGWENDSDLWKYGSSIAPFSRFVIKQYLVDSKQDIYQNRQLRLMVERKEDNTAIGTVDLYDFDLFHKRAGVGILIDRKYRGKGYARQTLLLLDTYCFGFLNLNQLYSFVSEKNTESIGLFKKAGYIVSGTLKKWSFSGDSFEDVQVMQKLNPSNP